MSGRIRTVGLLSAGLGAIALVALISNPAPGRAGCAEPGLVSEPNSGSVSRGIDGYLLAVVAEYGDSHADAFSGMWIERVNTLVVAFSKDLATHETAVLSLSQLSDDAGASPDGPPFTGWTVSEDPTPIYFVDAQYSQAYLETVTDEIVRSAGQLVSIGVNPRINRVMVGLEASLIDEVTERIVDIGSADAVCIYETLPGAED